MAIENTIAGSLLANYALIRDFKFKVIGEVYLNIKMNLLGVKGTSLKTIEKVESHPIALQQCKEFLYGINDNILLRETNDTAESAKIVSDLNDVKIAAVASARCAEIYNLEIIEKGIETNKQNFTRFLALSKNFLESEGNNKASVSFQLGHQVGSLNKVLTVFENHDINLTKIQSVPVIGQPYEYHFHVDVEWKQHQAFKNAVSDMLKFTAEFSLLGEYKKGVYNINE
jgi:prephenate dehydratase